MPHTIFAASTLAIFLDKALSDANGSINSLEDLYDLPDLSRNYRGVSVFKQTLVYSIS
jgi:hypothetical protein